MTRNSICQPSFWAALFRPVHPTHAHTCTQPLFTRQIRHLALTPSCRSARQGLARSDQSLSPLLSTSTGTSSSSSVPLQVHFSAKKRNHASWTEEADTLLLDLRAQGKTWSQIGQVFGKSRQACNRRFDAVLDPENGATFWTLHPERNQALLQLVAQGLGWKQIADRLGTKASACEKQWRILEQERIASAAVVVVAHVQGNPSMTAQSSKEQAQASMETMTTTSRFPLTHVQLLKNAVAEYGDDQWELIAEQVFRARFSPTFLRRQHVKLERTRRIWTENQDEHLLTETKRCYQRNHLPTPSPVVPSSLDVLSQSQWESVACTIPGDHSPAECRERWLRMHLNTTGQHWTQKNSLITMASTNDENKANAQTSQTSHDNRTSWTPEQSRRLEVIASHVKDDSTGGIDWDKVSELMDRKFTKQQCKSRWNRMLSRAKCTSSGPWDNKEIESLVQGICEFGDQWTKISQHWIPGRTPSFIQGKWKAIVGKLNQEMVIRRWTWAEVCVETYGESLGKPLGDLPSRWPKLCQSPRRGGESNT